MSRIGPDRKARSNGECAFLVGYYGVGNLGDEAIRQAAEREMTTLGVELVATAIRPGRPAAAGEVRLDWRGLFGYLRAIRHADRVVLGGGGILKDEGMRLMLDLAVTAVATRLLGRRLALLAVGVGPIYTRAGRLLVRVIASLSHVRTVRDEASAELLANLGVRRVEVGADPVFAASGGLRPAAAATDARGDPEASEPVSPTVLVAIRPWFFKASNGTTADEFRDRLASALRPLQERGWRVRLAALYWPRDRDESEVLRGLLGADSVELVGRDGLDWGELVALAADADLVIAMRYHALAAAAVAHRPVVALAYEPKVAALAEELSVPAIDVASPLLASSLGAAIEEGRGRPDPAAVDALESRSRLALRRALTG